MAGFGRALEKNGYVVLNLGYPSTKLSIGEIAGRINPGIEEFSRRVERLHFVGYSMGGLVIRAYLHRFRPGNLGRVVMLGTPNQGSEVADFIRDWRIYKKLYGPAGAELVTNLENRDALFGKIDYELGVIAGSRSVDPISSWLIGKPGDGKVSIESTKVEGMKAHRVISSSHPFLPVSSEARKLALEFLRKGEF